MNELEYTIKHRGFSDRSLLAKLSRRGFGGTLIGGALATASRLWHPNSVQAASPDFTLAIIPDPQYLAGTIGGGAYYAVLMNWLINNRNLSLTASSPSFAANIKAVVGVGDCVNTDNSSEYSYAGPGWNLLDSATPAFAWITPPGNHDYDGGNPGAGRNVLSPQFLGPGGYFSADTRSSVYGTGISLGNGDMAYYLGNYDDTVLANKPNSGANYAVEFVINGVSMVFIAVNLFCGNGAWAWAYGIHQAHLHSEVYITTHAWLTRSGSLFGDSSPFGTNYYFGSSSSTAMAATNAWPGTSPYSGTPAINTWSNLCGIFSGHDVPGPGNPSSQYYNLQTMKSSSTRGQNVNMLFSNAQEIDFQGTTTPNRSTGAGMFASIFLLSRRPSLGTIEGRMVSVQYGNIGQTNSWFETSAEGNIWSASEQILFSVPFSGLPGAAAGSVISGSSMSGAVLH